MDGPQCLGKQQSIDLCKSKGLLQQSRSSTLDLSVSQSCTYKQRIQNNYVKTIYHQQDRVHVESKTYFLSLNTKLKTRQAIAKVMPSSVMM